MAEYKAAKRRNERQGTPRGLVVSEQSSIDEQAYKVVVNHEEQYSIWPAHKENPLGWKDGGLSGTKAACLEHINQIWTDMRPLSLRKKLEEMERGD